MVVVKFPVTAGGTSSGEGEFMLESSNIERSSSAWASARDSVTAANRRAAASRAGL